MSILLAGCLTQSVPTQTNPTCSWTTTPPKDADRVCRRVFTVLSRVTDAIARDDERTIRRLAASDVAAHIVAYSRQLRPLHPTGLHVVPSFTMSVDARGLVGAGFYVLGKTSQARIKDQESVYLEVTPDAVRIAHDQTQQYW